MPTPKPDPADIAAADAIRALAKETGLPLGDAFDNVLRFEVRPLRVFARRLRTVAPRVPKHRARDILRRMADDLTDAVWTETVEREVPLRITKEAA
jgi:hypothetical protein